MKTTWRGTGVQGRKDGGEKEEEGKGAREWEDLRKRKKLRELKVESLGEKGERGEEKV